MRVVEIPFSSPCYPLPADYAALSSEGRRFARVNACRQWTLYKAFAHQSREEKSNLLACRQHATIASYDFFDLYYLRQGTPRFKADHPELDDDYDPGFYDTPPLPKPPFHDLITRACVAHKYVAAVAARGSSKTTKLTRDTITELVSWPKYSTLYITSSNPNSEVVGNRVRNQCYRNELIRQDFGFEYGGSMSPSRGTALMGMDNFALTNGSWFRCSSVDSRIRSARPMKVKIDDAEYDPSPNSDMEKLRIAFEYCITNECMPMVKKANTSLVVWGTYITEAHFLYFLTQTKDRVVNGYLVPAALDEKYDAWCRINQPAARVVGINKETGRRLYESAWPEMWPADDAEKIRLKLADDIETLPEIEKNHGIDVMDTEFLNDPKTGFSSYFPVLTEEQHGYTLTPLDARLPHLSNSIITWKRGDVPISYSLSGFLSRFGCFITLDTSYTNKAHSDFKCAHCLSLTDHNELISLDLWLDRCDESDLIKAAFQMAARWRASRIAPELSTTGKSLEGRLNDHVHLDTKSFFNVDYFPHVEGFDPGFDSKCSKIAAQKWRLDSGLAKFPFALLSDIHSPYAMLAWQIRGFRNNGGDNTGLGNDDALDTWAGARFIARTSPDTPLSAPTPVTALDMLKSGKTHLSGIPLAPLVIPSLSPHQFQELLDAVQRTGKPKHPFAPTSTNFI